MEPDLFTAAAEDRQSKDPASSPLAVRMRPRTLDEVVGQQHLLRPGAPLRRLVGEGEGGPAGPSSVILWGPPGTGKTTLAYVVSQATNKRFTELSAITAGVKEVRAVIDGARRASGGYGKETVLFLDEIHRFSKAQQDSLLPAVENRWVTLIAATTENPYFSVISPLLSRSLLLTLEPLTDEGLRDLLRRAVADERGLGGAVSLTADAENHLLRIAGGDARRALTALEAGAGSAISQGEEEITLRALEEAVDRAAVTYDRDGDQHYDVASALIKSIRGSDVDAALHYLARMIEAGEDPRFIARRLMISASEDIGMADPTALQTAVAAAQAVALIGFPEARIALGQAVIALALAPKSNAAYLAIDAALADVRAGLAGPVPPYLRDGHYKGAQKLGHAQGYVYPHDVPGGIAAQQYAPDAVHGKRYYEPTRYGTEARYADVAERVRARLRGDPPPRPPERAPSRPPAEERPERSGGEAAGEEGSAV
ncbi:MULTISPECIES: replication-associated recombination protein A [Streptomyces]|uniref:Replication-associated recombination protein A n=1 Tax=Streptomyces xinghaiensis TaxID=1038928 RepID=A0A420V5E6_9ACTN|nr:MULTISPECIES: replication-associated recombination protein A [Streptomyces]PQM22420.1 replication-associated recombination protein A [Streptomyces xinghaiensis]RKM96613.1 replication-associated recombination protein A [Streptomyces xinghaiensis]RNC74235.1 replication-associated recombination protein A [Streptomyces xinghaiensis]